MEALKDQIIVLREINPEYHGDIFDGFIEELRIIVNRENHPFKYKNEQQLVNILNAICLYLQKEYDTTMSFYLTKEDTIGMESDEILYEISLLPYILKQFKKCYRCGKRCDNGTRRKYALY